VFDDVNHTIEALLKAELPAEVAGQVTVSFATPDDSFPPTTLALPAINFFLFEIRENLELRDLSPLMERRADGSMQRTPAPVRVDCHYLVTAVAQQQVGGAERDEHRILGAVIKVLLRHRELPGALLQGSLAGKSPPVRSLTARPDAHPSGIELWQALKGKPRASLHYTLTVPVDIATPDAIAGPTLLVNVGGT
jgi:hypothetical protein